MKIDIHVHTKKTKAGDSPNREIDKSKFSEILKSTNVKILAITNHNHFDKRQYDEFREEVKEHCQIWPGVELDIVESGRRAHLIVIVNPKNSDKFSSVVNDLLEKSNPDAFTISLTEVVNNFDSMDAIYIAHYNNKTPNLIEEDINLLIKKVSNKKRVIKEATNSISAGIYISHGHNSIYGSDVSNWDNYVNESIYLPELRLPVDNYEQFCFLLEKDTATINTILNEKTKDRIQVVPDKWSAAEMLEIDIYNDINILFGSKGTGKSVILKAISDYYNAEGLKNRVYASTDSTLHAKYKIGENKLNTSATELGIDECEEELESIKEAEEVNITSMSEYYMHFSKQQTNKISKKIKINHIDKINNSKPKRDFDKIIETLANVEEFESSITDDEVLLDVIGKDLLGELSGLLSKIVVRINSATKERFVDLNSIALFNKLIETFSKEIAKKTQTPEKPSSTGFFEYASNRITIEVNLSKILSCLASKIEPSYELIGNLGHKGKLQCKTIVVMQDGKFSNSEYKTINEVNKTPQKNIALKLHDIKKHLYKNTLFEKISELNDKPNIETITCMTDFIQFTKHFILNDAPYNPSTGESSMVMLQTELEADKPIYIIDEPEKSLGNDYISEVIVPILNEKARQGKKVIIATHDANIAVRTLPYNSIYRKHDNKGHSTYKGNPFSNDLTNIHNDTDKLNWKEISMKTLEGGRDAFGERGKIYGKS